MLELLSAPRGHVLFPTEAGPLYVDGKVFRTQDGELWSWRGFSWFLGFLRYCRGEDVTPDLRWLRAHGFNIVRVFGPLPWIETPDYRVEQFDAQKFDAFLSLLETHGLRCEFVPLCYRFAPANDVSVRRFLQSVYDIAAAHWNTIVEVSNEPHVNKIDPIAAMAGVDRRGVVSAWGLYGSYYAALSVMPSTLDYV